MSLQGQHAVVTGGGKGIGESIARKLADLGAKLTLMGRHKDTLDAVASSLPEAQSVVCDVSDEANVKSAFAQAVESFGPVSILVNNAGIAGSSPFARTTLDQFQKIMDVNVTGTFLCTREVLPAMLESKTGRIVNIASTAGLEGNAYIAPYSASKHAMVGMTKSLAKEVLGTAITVNAICPGYTDTEMAQLAVDTAVSKTGKSLEEARAMIAQQNPQKRIIHPDEVAEMVAWLCLGNSSGITGQAIMIA